MNGLALNNLKSPTQIFNDEGILFYPRLFEGEELERLRDACEGILEHYYANARAQNPGGGENAISMRHLNDPQYTPDHPEDWRLIMETIADPRCLGPVEQIFRGESLFRTTSLFFNPRSDSFEGNWHRDHQFVLTDEDAVKAYFAAKQKDGPTTFEGIQLQIALVDNEDIEYVPFSPGRYDSPEEYYYRCADDRVHNTEPGMPNAMRIHQRAGDAVIFNPAGLHRGRYHIDKARRTLMLTYTPRQNPYNDYFSHQPWMLADGHLDAVSPRCRVYFQDFIDVYRDYWLEK